MKEEAKLVYLLECLQKTPPPVLVFAGACRVGTRQRFVMAGRMLTTRSSIRPHLHASHHAAPTRLSSHTSCA